MTAGGPQRLSAMTIPDAYSLPAAETGPEDTLRQTEFLLKDELTLFSRLMNLQLELMRGASHSRHRSLEMAAMAGLWSRAFSGLSDALLLVCRGSYSSAVPLIRTIAELIAAGEGLRGGEMVEHERWLSTTMEADQTHKALDLGLGRYFAGEVLASDALLRSIYRPASDLGRPNFGATVLQVGPESNNHRLALAFADSSFHLGWAQLLAGWLLGLAQRQIEVVLESSRVFPVSDADRTASDEAVKATQELLSDRDRCRVDVVEDGSERRYLVVNFRRSAGAAPKKVLL